jgi:hypothetical protein
VRRRWSPRGLLALLLIVAVWATCGVGVYLYLGSHRTALTSQALKPGQTRQARDAPINHLPGVLYLVQDGTVYQLRAGRFTPVLSSPGGATSWAQPSLSADAQSLLVVRRDYAFSDLYSADAAGHGLTQLTHNASKTVELNHWAFYPRLAPDGTMFFSYDAKDRFNNYNVVLSIYQMPVGGAIGQARRWTTPNSYTGGDLQPIPLASGGLLYTKYVFDNATSRILGQIWLTTRAGLPGRALTPAADDCSQPALSPDGTRLAMICTAAKQFASVEVAAFDGANLGPRVPLVTGQLASQPTWAPDGASLVYLAPTGTAGHFQLWRQVVPALPLPTVPPPTPAPAQARAAVRAGQATSTPTQVPTPTTTASPTPTPTPLPAAVQLTLDNDFDATSTIAWHA